MQWAAVGLGALAVVVLTVDYGRPPWIALTLAFSFGTYGLLKKQVGATVGAVESLTVETAVLFVPALAYLVVLDARGDAQFGHSGLGHGLLLASAGIATAVPLLFFASAARRIPLSTLGLLQYIAPVLQFLTGVVLYDEPMPASRWAGFVLVWAALAVLTFDGLRQGHRTRRDTRAQLAHEHRSVIVSARLGRLGCPQRRCPRERFRDQKGTSRAIYRAVVGRSRQGMFGRALTPATTSIKARHERKTCRSFADARMMEPARCRPGPDGAGVPRHLRRLLPATGRAAVRGHRGCG